MNNTDCPKCGSPRSRNKSVKICPSCGVNYAKHALLIHRQEMSKTMNSEASNENSVGMIEKESDIKNGILFLSMSMILSAVYSILSLAFPQMTVSFGKSILLIPAINCLMYIMALYFFIRSKISGVTSLLKVATVLVCISSTYSLYVSYQLVELGQKMQELSEQMLQRH